MGGWMDGWMGGKAWLRIAYSNQITKFGFFKKLEKSQNKVTNLAVGMI